MKRSIFGFASICVAALLCACATPGAAPNAAQVADIQTACAVDAGLRPTVTGLLAIPGLATVDEVAAVTAARAVIDPICANPGGTVQANAIAAVTSASAQVLGIVTQLQARKSGSAAAVEPAAAASQ